MAAPSPATLFGVQEEDLKNHQNQELQHSRGEGASVAMAFSPSAGAASPTRKRSHPGNPNPDAEVVALSPKTIMAKNQFWCEVCNTGFQREQNLQLHRRGHNLPWKLKKKTNHEAIRKKVYVCPEPGCVHHDPSRALGDLTGIKKHFARKHGEKKFSCERCNKKYAVYSDWKAHNKICGTKEYKCDCGTTFSRHDSFISHRSFCDALAGDVARHTNLSPYSSMDASILANASKGMDDSILANDTNPGSMSLGSAAGSLIPGNHQQLSSPPSVGSVFQPMLPIQQPNMSLHSFSEQNLCFPRASDSSGIHGFPSYTALGNMSNFGFSNDADLNYPQNDLNLNINNSFSGLLMNVETSAYNILNSTPFPQFLAPTHFQKAALTVADSDNVAFMNSMGSSLYGTMKFNNYGGDWGDKVSHGGRVGSSTFQEVYNSPNVGGGRTPGYGGGMEYESDQMNAPYGGMMYNVRNADWTLVGEVNNNVLVEPEIIVQSEYCDKLTRDFLGMGNRMNSFSRTGREDDAIGIGTSSPESEATISAESRSFVPGRHPGF